MESMKMESAVASPCDGLVEKVLVTVGQAVESGETLLVYKR
jgi:propionyl-CoA carboxylase alpha chain